MVTRGPKLDRMPAVLQSGSRALRVFQKIDFIGAGLTGADARDVFTRLRRGEPVLDGPHVAAFEHALSEYYGLPAITFGGARMAMFAILQALGIGAGDEVILAGYGCVVIPNAICRLGAKPVYVDVARTDYNIIPELAERAITPRTRAILAQHTFGVACNMDALLDIGRRKGLPVIEDGAHAIGARLDGQLLGRLGDAAFFSTQETKMLNTSQGGFVITRDAELARKVREIQQRAAHLPAELAYASTLRWCFQAALFTRPACTRLANFLMALAVQRHVPGLSRVFLSNYAAYRAELASEPYAPFPTPLPNLLAYAGWLQLRRLEAEIAHRRRLAAYLEARLPALGAAVQPYDPRRVQPSWVRFPFVVADRAPWMAATRASVFYPGVWLNDPIHPHGSNWARVGYAAGRCPNAEYLSGHILNIPVDTRVREFHLARWLRECRRVLGDRRFAAPGDEPRASCAAFAEPSLTGAVI